MTTSTLSPSGYTFLHYLTVGDIEAARALEYDKLASMYAERGDETTASAYRYKAIIAARHAALDHEFADMLLNSEI